MYPQLRNGRPATSHASNGQAEQAESDRNNAAAKKLLKALTPYIGQQFEEIELLMMGGMGLELAGRQIVILAIMANGYLFSQDLYDQLAKNLGLVIEQPTQNGQDEQTEVLAINASV